VFFGNSQCLSCRTPLGYEPMLLKLLPLQEGSEAGRWRIWGDETSKDYRRCGNFDSPARCNWLVRANDKDTGGRLQKLCVACRLNRTIPNLDAQVEQRRWADVELAKRRLVSQLIGLGLPVRSKMDEDQTHGLAFDLLSPGRAPVTTGHDNGLITINVAEADDAERERIRAALGEPYRTLLGHLRHEVGHYYWHRLVRDSGWLPHVRDLFGDDRQNYADSLERNRQQGPAANWRQQHITSYASSHPWEDWAETWAHYLHMVDTMDTALSFGIDADNVHLDARPWGPESLWKPDAPTADAFLGFLNAWTELTAVLNEMSRSMGQPDFYPFVLPRPAVAKLQMIDLIVRGTAP
jgi:hypothetical protein